MNEHAHVDAASRLPLPPALLPDIAVPLGDDAAFVSDAVELASILQEVMTADRVLAGTFVVAAMAAPLLSTMDLRRLAGTDLARSPTEGFMLEAEGLRNRMAAASEGVHATCGFFPLLSPDDHLSDFRAAIVERDPRAFVAAAEARGRTLPGRDAVTAAGRAIGTYLTARDRYHAMAEEFCPHAPDAGWLASRLLLRAHLRSAADAMGIAWHAVSDQCRLRPSVSVESLGSLAARKDAFSSVARLRRVIESREAALDIETAIALAVRDAVQADPDRGQPAPGLGMLAG